MSQKKKYKTFIAEDMLPARDRLTSFILNRPELDITDSARTGKEALQKLTIHNYDLLFIDIHLPVMSGIEVLEKLDDIPYVIFTTAYDQFALKAFELGALDYLLKPFSRQRFNHAVDKFLKIITHNIPFDIYHGIELMKGPEKYTKSSLTEKDATLYAQRLIHYIKETKVYKDSNVTLRKLADDLGITPNHLSQAMNQILQKNYYEFINGYRIEDAKNALVDAANTKKTILDIAFDVGFKSKSVFNTVFKEHTNVTPSQYRQQSKTL